MGAGRRRGARPDPRERAGAAAASSQKLTPEERAAAPREQKLTPEEREARRAAAAAREAAARSPSQ
jgi:hypothetical protein